MKVRLCDRCKKILSKEPKIFSYNFDSSLDGRFWAKDILCGVFCFSCYKEFENFLNQEESYEK